MAVLRWLDRFEESAGHGISNLEPTTSMSSAFSVTTAESTNHSEQPPPKANPSSPDSSM